MLGNWARKDFDEKKIRSARFRAEPKGVPKMAKSEKTRPTRYSGRFWVGLDKECYFHS